MGFAALRYVLAVFLLATVAQAADEVKVSSYSFDGTTFSGTLSVKNIAYTKVVTANYATAALTWGNKCTASYTSGPDSNSKEVWSFSCTISSAGIAQFYVSYSVSGTTYYDNNGGSNYKVTTTKVLPSGFQSDITSYFSSALSSFKSFLLANISPTSVSNALSGSIIAATSSSANNYIYHWIRDAALTMDVVNTLYKNGDTSLEQKFWDHATFSKKLQGLTTLTGLGEPKYNVDGTAFSDSWCRPQNDGPALRASSFIRFSKAYLANGGSLSKIVDLYNSSGSGIIKNDLEYVSKNYDDSNGCDLWEEQRGIHFFTVAAQRRAMYEGRDFANYLGDTGAASWYNTQAATLDTKLASFWNSGSQVVQTTLSGRLLDAAIPLGAVHGDNGDGVLSPESEKVLATVFQLETGFISEYTLNSNVKVDSSGLNLSVAIGRYYGDTYDGSSTSSGNPWYLCTAIVAETAYRAAIAFVKAGSLTVTSLNQKLFNGATPAGLGLSIATGTYASGSTSFDAIIKALETYGDIHIRRVKYHGASGYHLNEQYNRATGYAQGVNDLTWSYAAMISANLAREELRVLTGNN